MIHQRTRNLGDAIQTLALARLLGVPCRGVYRDEPVPEAGAEVPLVVNGWLGYLRPDPSVKALFAGVHIAAYHRDFARWMAQSRSPVGARDPFTAALLRGAVPCQMVGCATLTFERYRGHRAGRYSIDVPTVAGTTPLTQEIGDIDWTSQWNLAIHQLDLLRRAEIVYSSRLHVILPCLAFGTPVVFPMECLDRVGQRERLTLLQELPFQFDEPVTTDVTALADRFVDHLERLTGPIQAVNVPPMPVPL